MIKTIHTDEFPELLVLNIGQLLETILLYSVIIIFISPDEVTNTLFLIGTIQTLTGGIHKSIQAYTKLKTNINRFTDTISWFSLDNDQTNEQVQPSRIKETKILCAADHISFCFPGNNKNTINNVSFSIYQGEHIAIVGPNGSGKSTLIKLLSELYSPSKGMLHFYEVEHKICPVFQDFFLFAYSLKENITFSSNQMQGVKETLSSCDFKPHDAGFSLETPLYKDIYNTGVQLSGGESQKVAIARSIYNAGQLFVFDEPTSALDPISEKEIFELMETLTKDKTVVFVSHRLASCQHCDRILVVDHGRIVQEGTHAELVNQEGLYRDMWNAQADFYMKK